MQSWLRKLTGLVAMALLVAVPVLATGAAAVEPGEGAPDSPGDCSFLIGGLDANGQAPTGATSVSITVSGVVPVVVAGVEVELFVGGTSTSTQVTTNGSYSFGPLTVPVPIDIAVSYNYGNENAYTTVCLGPGGTSVFRINAAGAVRGPLAFTGSSNTGTNVLIGAAAILFGTVLVVASRRRSRVQV